MERVCPKMRPRRRILGQTLSTANSVYYINSILLGKTSLSKEFYIIPFKEETINSP